MVFIQLSFIFHFLNYSFAVILQLICNYDDAFVMMFKLLFFLRLQ